MENKINNTGNMIIGGTGNSIVNNTPHNSDPIKNNEEMAKTPSWKESVLELLTKGDLRNALSFLMKADENIEVQNQSILLLGRLSKLEMDIISGSITKGKEVLEANQIRAAIMLLLART